ncbi:hypothetical protein A6R68_00012, partial [Neotoma lepida]
DGLRKCNSQRLQTCGPYRHGHILVHTPDGRQEHQLSFFVSEPSSSHVILAGYQCPLSLLLLITVFSLFQKLHCMQPQALSLHTQLFTDSRGKRLTRKSH